MAIDLEKYGTDRNLCIHLPMYNYSIALSRILDKMGRKWAFGERYTKNNNWNVYKSDTVYFINEGTYARIGYARDTGANIIEWGDLT